MRDRERTDTIFVLVTCVAFVFTGCFFGYALIAGTLDEAHLAAGQCVGMGR